MVDRSASRLYHEHVGATYVFLNLDIVLPVGESHHLGMRQLETEVAADLFGQRAVGITAEDFDAIRVHRAYRLRGGHSFSFVVCAASRLHHSARYLARLTSA